MDLDDEYDLIYCSMCGSRLDEDGFCPNENHDYVDNFWDDDIFDDYFDLRPGYDYIDPKDNDEEEFKS
jgi:hypothetical protein